MVVEDAGDYSNSNKVQSCSGGSMDNGSNKRRTRKKALQLHHLPPDILRDILSRLQFKEAAWMSILSNKWRRLWRCYENPVFTRETMFGSGINTVRSRRRFIINVNSVLRQLRSTTLKKFVVKFKLRKAQAHHVDRWVSFAAMSNTNHITFDFSPGSWGDDHGNRYIFPLQHFSGSSGRSVRSLRLMFVCLMPPLDFCGFTNLKKLKLDAVSIPGHLQCLLPECSVLEWLSIVRCTLHGLHTSQPLHRLRYLNVRACHGMQKIELQAPNLVTFRFDDSPMPIVLGGCLKMAEASVVLLASSDCFDYAFTELPGGIPHVRKLSMGLIIDTKEQAFTKPPINFVNLRHLVLTMEIFGIFEPSSSVLRFTYLLELAPVLEQLELHMECHGDGEIILQLQDMLQPPRPHNHLKVLHMTGVYAYKSLLNLALYIARNAKALERMVIDPMVKKSYELTRDEEAECAIRRGRKMAERHLQGRGLDDILTIL
ncbi:hypothetical protein ACP4OV_026437 [Aristida adscensionis]